ncbi:MULTISPECIES: hypothetical protein [Streptomyces]|uniref:hypothetical protein n=1 Tax=Streptomyces TaxID=1883 RepID=UPI00163C9C21|nr:MULTISPECIES: hypothetical protein [Streptomyces]MBC2878793.1 hypothetical protein [Streptomyces sp. TYQ1024]UBI39288.1 hypothetical protein K7I03_24400 [Streptomyces mobaraensis]UKW31869.1 hypothetical protein MCU78_24340 [Streptomyces sp. TYQ1024]
MTTEIDYGRFAERLEAARRVAATEPAGSAARWELLRAFQEEWGYEPTGGARWERDEPDAHKEYVTGLRPAAPEGDGTDAEPDDVDRSLPIPAALDEWWDLPFNSFADRWRLYWTNPVWPPTVRPDPTGYGVADGLPRDNPFTGPDEDPRVCVLMAEDQFCNEWGYPAARAHLVDPPVLVTVEDREWTLQSHSVSEFFLALAAVRLPDHYGWTVEEPELTPEAMARLREVLRPMGLLPWRELGAHTEFLGGPDVIAQHNTGYGDTELAFYGRTEAALHRLAAALGTDWSEEIAEPESHHEEP